MRTMKIWMNERINGKYFSVCGNCAFSHTWDGNRFIYEAVNLKTGIKDFSSPIVAKVVQWIEGQA